MAVAFLVPFHLQRTAGAMNNSPRHLLGTTGASTSLVRQVGVAFGPALATTLWALPGYSITGMRVAIGVAAMLASRSFLALVRTPRTVPTAERTSR